MTRWSTRTVVVVGASIAGVRSAEALVRQGFDGKLMLVGSEPHFPPYDRPPLSKQVLNGTWEEERARLRVVNDLPVELILGETATEIDLHESVVELGSGRRLHFDGLVVATGAVPRLLPSQPRSLPGLFVLRTIDDCLALRAEFKRGSSVAVVGGGFIGCEVAAAARSIGLDVTLIDVLDLPLRDSCGSLVGEFVAHLHKSQGVKLRLGCGVAGFDGFRRVEGVRLQDGSRIAADIVVVGVGAAPATGWLTRSGLDVQDGVRCDSTGAAVGAPHIVAAGDVARWWNPLFQTSLRVEHWTNAVEQPALATRTLLAGPESFRAPVSVPYVWSDQYDNQIQMLGIPRGPATLTEGAPENGSFAAVYTLSGRVVGAVCVNLAGRLMTYRKLIARGANIGEALNPRGGSAATIAL